MNISQVLETTKMIQFNDTKSKEIIATYFLGMVTSRHASNKFFKKENKLTLSFTQVASEGMCSILNLIQQKN